MSTGKEQWRPTREYFEQNPRSVTLRNLCIKAIDAAELALASGGEDVDAIHEIFELNTSLHELGIEPKMHVISREDPEADIKRLELMSNPVATIEWLAGQVCMALESGATARRIHTSDIAEHDELCGRGGRVSLVEIRAMSPNVRQFLANYTLIGSLKGFVDYSAGPTEE